MDFKRRLLNHLGIDEREASFLFSEPSIDQIPRIDDDPAVKKAVQILEETKKSGGRLICYGDYDCDGATSTTIAVRALREFGLEAAFYLPSRPLDGYGITMENAKNIVSAGYSTIVLLDNGIAANEQIAYLKENGLRVIAIDHHEIEGGLPNADAIIHPDTINYPKPNVSAGYLSFLFSLVLLGRVDPYLCFLGGLSSIADMMPMKAHNRTMVRLAYDYLQEFSFPGIMPFISGKNRSYEILNHDIAPFINAVGRVEEGRKVSRVVNYLLTADQKADEALLSYILEINAKKKEIIAESANLPVDSSGASIVVVSPYTEGINGIIANNVIGKHQKPTCVFAEKSGNPDILVGSMRSRKGLSIVAFYRESGIDFLSAGGHEGAGGVSIRKSDLPLFKERLEEYSLAHPVEPEDTSPFRLGRDELTLENCRIVESLGPFGNDFPEPFFLLGGIGYGELGYSKDGRYLSVRLPGGASIFSFRHGRKHFEEGRVYSFLGHLKVNSFNGRESARLSVVEAEAE